MKTRMLSILLVAMFLIGMLHFAFVQTVEAPSPPLPTYMEALSVFKSGETIIEWMHTYDYSADPISWATLTIVADDVDLDEKDEVYFNGNYLGVLNDMDTYIESVGYGPDPGNPVAGEITVTVFDLDPSWISDSMSVAVEIEGEYIVEIETSTLTIQGSTHGALRVNLVAGGGNPKSAMCVGWVIVWNDADCLYVKYVTRCNWVLTETHLAVATAVCGIPQTKKGNPIPGRFQWKHECLGYVHEDTYCLPLNCGACTRLVIAAHAVVVRSCVHWETAWGAGCPFPGRNWATYFEYTLQCT